MTRKNLPVWLAIAFLAPALLSIFSIYRRDQAESLNRAVSFAVEFDTLDTMAAAQGVPVQTAITQLKAQGLNAVVLSEETLAELIGKGRVSINSSYLAPGGANPDIASLRVGDPRDLERIRRALSIRLQGLAGPLTARDGMLPLPPVSTSLLRATPIGLNTDQAAVANANGLLIIARCANPPAVGTKTVEETLKWARELGATIFLPMGDQVLGRRDAITTTEDTLHNLGMLYASAEFAKIGGDEEVLRTAPENVVRLHSAQVAELDKLSLPDAVERYSKAARERNMRILLIRPFSSGSDMPLTNFGDFLHRIRSELLRSGYALGTPKAFSEPGLPSWYPIPIAISLLPATFFVGTQFFTGRRARLVGGILLALIGLASPTHIGIQVAALLATLTFPVAGFLVLDALRPKNVWLGFVLVSAISLIGGLCVAGMLNGVAYYVMAKEFSGVKASIFLPILIIGYLFMVRLGDVKEVLKRPITWGTAMLGLTIIAVLAVMIARTGNDTGVSASDSELVFRGVLDRYLYVRPRTKEFMIGHPILMVGIGLLGYLTRRPVKAPLLGGWAALLLMVGAMGQTSMVNTLTHLHIPVMLSLARDGLGLLIGSIIGAGLWAIVSRLLPMGEEA